MFPGVRAVSLFLFLAFVFSPISAHAARFSGAYMVKICGVNKNGKQIAPGAHAACQSYIAGVIDYHNMLRSMRIAPDINICVPESVTMNELHLTVLKYLERHPEHDSFVAAPAILLGLFEKYPCRK